jgi:hypothetical protein
MKFWMQSSFQLTTPDPRHNPSTRTSSNSALILDDLSCSPLHRRVPSHSVQCVPKKHEPAAVSRLHTVDTDSRAASKRPYYHATLYAGLVCTPPAVYFRKCNTASSQTKRRLAVTPVRESSPADKDRLTGYKNMRRSHPLLPGKLEIYSILSIRHWNRSKAKW